MHLSYPIAAIVLLGQVGPALAAAAPGSIDPRQASTSVRLQARLSVLQYGAVGLQVSRRLVPHFGLDVTLSRADLGRDHTGPMLEAMARGFLFRGQHGVSVAAGVAGLVAREYGKLAILQGELAYEVRARKALSLLVGVGPQVALNRTGEATCAPGTEWCYLLWKHQYLPGDTAVHVRLALGYSF
jgi:hypothetical protein